MIELGFGEKLEEAGTGVQPQAGTHTHTICTTSIPAFVGGTDR